MHLFKGAAGMLNLGNLNLRDIILSYRLQGLLSTAPNKYRTTPSVCGETADTNRPIDTAIGYIIWTAPDCIFIAVQTLSFSSKRKHKLISTSLLKF